MKVLFGIREGEGVRGPYTACEIGQMLLQGEVQPTDMVSNDSRHWGPVTEFAELIPEEMLNLDTHGWTPERV